MPSQKQLMDIETFLEEYSLSRGSFYSHVKKKTLRITKDGARTFIARQDAEEWLQNLRKDTETPS